MRTLSAFVFVSINGFYKGPEDDISWHNHGEEGTTYSEQQLASGNILLFGRKTYDMMNSFWPTPMAAELYPQVAKGMNAAEKWVVSTTLEKANWQHTEVLQNIESIRNLKQTPGKNITLLGSGSLMNELTKARLIDEFVLWMDPILLKSGTPLFQDLDLNLTLVNHQVFENSGAVLLTYRPL